MVRKWMVKDTVHLAAKAAPAFCNPQEQHYLEVGAPKQKVTRCFPFSLCMPCFCCDSKTKFFWGAPSFRGREVCILSVRNAMCDNYIFDLVDMESFIKDNKADYSVVPAGRAPPPQILGHCEDAKLKCTLDSPASTTASASPLGSSIASPLSAFASPSGTYASPMGLGCEKIALDLQRIEETSTMSFQELHADLSNIHSSSSENSPTSGGSPAQVESPRDNRPTNAA